MNISKTNKYLNPPPKKPQVAASQCIVTSSKVIKGDSVKSHDLNRTETVRHKF